MNRIFYLLAICLFFGIFVTSASAGVYKRVNPDGSIEFTDIPDEVGQKPIEISPQSTYKAPPPPPGPTEPPNSSAKGTATSYESVSVTSPANDTTVRDSEGNISISVSSRPGLQQGHSYILIMDGKQVGKGSSNKFQLTNVDRGSHTLSAKVVDKDNKILIQSESVTVHLHRATATGNTQRSPVRPPRK